MAAIHEIISALENKVKVAIKFLKENCCCKDDACKKLGITCIFCDCRKELEK